MNNMDIDLWADKVLEAFEKLPTEGLPRNYVLTTEEVEAMYASGYQLYRQGDLERAIQIFNYLCLYEGNDARFWTAMAITLHKQQKWEPAINAYSMAALLDATNVSLYFYATECLMTSRQWQRAKQSLEAFFRVCKNVYGEDTDNSEVRQLMDKAEVWKDVVKTRLSAHSAPAPGENAPGKDSLTD